MTDGGAVPHTPIQPHRSQFSTPIIIWLAAITLGVILAVAPLPQLVLIAGGMLAVTLALAHPTLAVGLVVLSVPVQELATLPGGLTYTQAATLLALGSWFLHTLAHPERRALPGGILPLWGILFVALTLSAGLTPFSRSEAIRETMRWAVAASIWLVAASTITRRWQVFYLLSCLLLAPAVSAGIGIAQFVGGDGPPAFRIAPDLPFVRAYGTIGQPNSFAGYMNMAWPLALALATGLTVYAWQGRTSRRDGACWVLAALVWGVTLLLLAALLASFSRGAWLGAAIGALGLALSLGRRARPALLVVGLIAVAAIVLAFAGVLPAPLAERIASVGRSLVFFDAAATPVTPENFAVVERMAQLQAGWRMFLSAPLTGVGPGNYSVAYPHFAVGTWYISRGHAHNYYVHISAEVGILGLLAYLILISGVIRQAVIALRRAPDSISRSVVIGGCGMIAAVAGHQLFENLHVLNMSIQIVTVWAIFHAVARQDANLRGCTCGISSPAEPVSSAAI